MRSAGNQPIVQVRGLTKRFGTVEAVSDLSFDIQCGEVFGLLGPNGAGKTTTIRLMLGLERPTAGSLTVAGLQVGDASQILKKKIGWVPQSTSADPLLTGAEQLRMMAELYRVEQPSARVQELLERFGLSEARNRRISSYSGGMQRRLELATGVLQQPELLILDEPTASLDVETRHQIWDMVRELNASGTTVVLTTHYLDEADVLCDRVAIVDHGTLRALDVPARLKSRYGQPELRLAWNESADFLLACTVIADVPCVTVEKNLNRCVVSGEGRVEVLDRLLQRLRQQGAPVPNSIESSSASLDQVFAKVTGREFDPVTGAAMGADSDPDVVEGERLASRNESAGPVTELGPTGETHISTHANASQSFAHTAITFARNNITLLKRWWWRLQRDRFTLGLALLQPALWLILFGSLWEDVVDAEWADGGYLQFVTAGAVMMTVFNFGLMAGLEVVVDRERGALDRLLVAPVVPLSLVTSRVLFISAVGTAQTVVIIVVASLLGVQFQAGVVGIVGLMVLASLLGAGVAATSLLLGFAVANHGQFYTVTGLVALPLILISTVFAPIDAMPDWLAALASANPMSYAVDGARSMVLGGSRFANYLVNGAVLVAFVMLVLLMGALLGKRRLSASS